MCGNYTPALAVLSSPALSGPTGMDDEGARPPCTDNAGAQVPFSAKPVAGARW